MRGAGGLHKFVWSFIFHSVSILSREKVHHSPSVINDSIHSYSHTLIMDWIGVSAVCVHAMQAMAIGALPHNAGAISTALAILADELAFLSGDRSTDLSWYGKRVLIAGIYASSGTSTYLTDSMLRAWRHVEVADFLILWARYGQTVLPVGQARAMDSDELP